MAFSSTSLPERFLRKTKDCEHLAQFRNQDIHTYGSFKTIENLREYLFCWKYGMLDKDKIPPPNCFECDTVHGVVFGCLHCFYFGCHEYGHFKQHYQQEGHPLCMSIRILQLNEPYCMPALDIVNDEIYCFQCQSYIYSSCTSEEGSIHIENQLVNNCQQNGLNLTKEEIDTISEFADPCEVPSNLLGVRGLNNLGNTCFMSVALQALVHNPFLMKYFLNDQHSLSTCPLSKVKKFCLGCEMDYLFASMYNGENEPLSPHHFLFTTWKCSDHLAGYDQQDAHDFFISSLNGIHNHFETARLMNERANGTSGQISTKPNGDHKDSPSKSCPCLVHRLFSGTLQSNLRCNSCNYSSISNDPFFDISLNVNSNNQTKDEYVLTLEDALKKYTSPELLEKYTCNNCKSTMDTTKQLTVSLLPNSLCFHFKRFKHTAMANSTKLETYVQFPLEFDMSPFTSKGIKDEKAMDMNGSSTCNEEMYSLYAVINHTGNMETGHYTCYIRNAKNTWFKCDDHVVTKVYSNEVLESKAYILFYIKNVIHYENKS